MKWIVGLLFGLLLATNAAATTTTTTSSTSTTLSLGQQGLSYQVTCNTADTFMRPANLARKRILIKNGTATNLLYVCFFGDRPCSATLGFKLKESEQIESLNYRGEVRCFSVTGDTTANIIEE